MAPPSVLDWKSVSTACGRASVSGSCAVACRLFGTSSVGVKAFTTRGPVACLPCLVHGVLCFPTECATEDCHRQRQVTAPSQRIFCNVCKMHRYARLADRMPGQQSHRRGVSQPAHRQRIMSRHRAFAARGDQQPTSLRQAGVGAEKLRQLALGPDVVQYEQQRTAALQQFRCPGCQLLAANAQCINRRVKARAD